MKRAAEELIGPITQFYSAVAERKLHSIGLSGRRVFRGVVLGGGTLINEYTRDACQKVLEWGVPLASLGTGAGSAGHDMPEEIDLSGWESVLQRFHMIGLRGPRSLRLVETMGINRARIVGDLALHFAQEQVKPSNTCQKKFGLNLIPPHRNACYDYQQLMMIGEACRHLISDGWQPVFIATSPEDENAIDTVITACCGITPVVHHPASVEHFFELVADCIVIISMRLHGSVLGVCAGVPPLIVSYRGKCQDFAESMSLEDHVLPVQSINRDIILECVQWIEQEGYDLRCRILSAARKYQHELLRFSQEVQSVYTNR